MCLICSAVVEPFTGVTKDIKATDEYFFNLFLRLIMTLSAWYLICCEPCRARSWNLVRQFGSNIKGESHQTL